MLRSDFKQKITLDTFIGLTIIFLPLYIRLVGNLETNRISKDNLFLYLILGSLIFLDGSIKYKYLRYAVTGLISLVILNQHHPFSQNVISQTVFIISALVFFIKYYEYDGKRDIQKIYDGMIIGSLIQAVLAIAGYFGTNLYYYLVTYIDIKIYIYPSVTKERWVLDYILPNIVAEYKGNPIGNDNAVGSLGNCNLTASYLCMTIPAFLSRRCIKYLAIIPITALLLTSSYMGIAAFLAGIIYYLNMRLSKTGYFFPKIFVYGSTIIGMLIFPMLNLNLDSGRVTLWRKVLKEASLKHWLIGMGPGWFPDMRFLISATERAGQEHSNFLAIFNIFGILGFVILFPIFYKYLKVKNDDRILSTILFIIFCNSFGHFSFHQSTVLIIIIPLLALSLPRDRSLL